MERYYYRNILGTKYIITDFPLKNNEYYQITEEEFLAYYHKESKDVTS